MSDTAVSASEDARNAAEALKLEAEARKLVAEAREAEAKARKAEIDLIVSEEKERARVLSDEHLHIYRFSSEVSASSVNACMAQLELWHRLDPYCDIEIIFNSPGGLVYSGMAMFDLITRLSLRGGGTHKITAGAQGYAASMAGILVQSADVRWIGRQSYLMIHEVSTGVMGKASDIQDEAKLVSRMCDRIVDIFLERSDGKISKAKFVRSWDRKNWWLPSEEALKYGFVDDIR